MKKKALQFAIGLLIISNGAFAQQWNGNNNTTDAISRNGSVGIGTVTPQADLHVIGAMKVEANVDNGSIGGRLIIAHPGKTVNGTAREWAIYNMSGVYGNSLQFWAYDNVGCQSGGLCHSRLTIMDNGNVGIGTNPGSWKLAVEGKIAAREIQVTLDSFFPDYVFSPSYKLRNLFSLEKYINQYQHLPGIPSAKEVEKEGGFKLGEMNIKLLEKVEELTLYVIELKKEIEEIKKKSNNSSSAKK